MSNKRTTKRALFSSVIAMLLCVAMLIGTTFAWFTDSVTSSGNKIQSGNLNIDLLVKDTGGTYRSVKENNNAIFDYDKWEPGYTEVKNVKVTTSGNLALKYAVSIVPRSTTEDAFKLAEVIDVYYANSEVDVANRDLSGLTRIGTLKDFFTAGTVINDTLIPDQGNTEDFATIVLKMQESANNDYQGLSVGNGFDLHVVATQYTHEKDSFGNNYDLTAEYPDTTVPSTATVKTAAELKAVLTAFTDAGSGNSVVTIEEDITLAEGETWTPVTVDGYHGAGVITINGNGHTIKGLNAPLIAGGFAGESGVVINGLTIEDANIGDTYADQGLGAFICSIDSMPKIVLNDCHLKNSTINSIGGARVGGLIGWTAGYNNPNDGPVDTYITVTNCSVKNCSITAAGSVGAIIGHAGNNPATYHTITGCTVTCTTLNSTDGGDWRVGVIVGTANVGQVTISGTTESNNTLTQTGKTAPVQSNLYGRLVLGDTGKLTIDGTEIKK